MSTPLSQDVKQLIDGPNFAHLATLMADGSPQSVPVWVGREGDRIRARLQMGAAARETLRADATAELRVPIAGLVGDLAIALDPGSLPAPWPEGKVMEGEAEGEEATGAPAAAREQAPELQERTG